MVEFDRSRMKFLVGWLFLMVFWVFDVWLFLNPPENFSFFHNQPVNLVAGVLFVLPVAMFARMTLALRPCLKVTQDELVADTLVRGFLAEKCQNPMERHQICQASLNPWP